MHGLEPELHRNAYYSLFYKKKDCFISLSVREYNSIIRNISYNRHNLKTLRLV